MLGSRDLFLWTSKDRLLLHVPRKRISSAHGLAEHSSGLITVALSASFLHVYPLMETNRENVRSQERSARPTLVPIPLPCLHREQSPSLVGTPRGQATPGQELKKPILTQTNISCRKTVTWMTVLTGTLLLGNVPWESQVLPLPAVAGMRIPPACSGCAGLSRAGVPAAAKRPRSLKPPSFSLNGFSALPRHPNLLLGFQTCKEGISLP